MNLYEIINILESVAPLKWQEGWDNSGLQIGNRNATIHKALLTTDVTEPVVGEAVRLHCDLIISHHPLLFHGLKHLTGDSPEERIAAEAVRRNIAIYSSHTAMDSYLHGVSGKMAEKLGLNIERFLSPADDEHGLGLIGSLPAPERLDNVLLKVQNAFSAPVLRYVGDPSVLIQKVALCGGAGAEFIPDAVRAGADLYITSDIKYHEFQQAVGHIALIDMDHWVSEHFTVELFRDILSPYISTVISQADASPVKVFTHTLDN